jgi:hypothetical protein
MTVSAGVATYGPATGESDSLNGAADATMYKAKRLVRDRVLDAVSAGKTRGRNPLEFAPADQRTESPTEFLNVHWPSRTRSGGPVARSKAGGFGASPRRHELRPGL